MLGVGEGVRWMGRMGGKGEGAYEWKSATVALSPGGSWINS